VKLIEWRVKTSFSRHQRPDSDALLLGASGGPKDMVVPLEECLAVQESRLPVRSTPPTLPAVLGQRPKLSPMGVDLILHQRRDSTCGPQCRAFGRPQELIAPPC